MSHFFSSHLVKVLLAALLFSLNCNAERMAIMGDSGSAGSSLDQLKSSLLKENVKSIIMPGDNLYSGTYESTWDDWKTSGFSFDVVAIGNHNKGYSQEIKYFKMQNEFYSVVKNGARFIVLNSDNQSNVSSQFDWLRKELAASTEALVFLVYHHPTFTISRSHTWQEKETFQLQMREFLKQNQNRITAILIGHDHMSEFMNFGSTPVVVAGSGREVRNERPVSYVEDGFKIETRYLAPATAHWGLLEIQPGRNEALIHFIRVSDQKRSCTARFKNSEMTLDGNCQSNN